MKNQFTIKCVIAFLLLLPRQSSGQPLIPRLGDEIDAKEREYFGLLPNIVGFKEARMALVNHKIACVISRQVVDIFLDTTIILSPHDYSLLKQFIERFDDFAREADIASRFEDMNEIISVMETKNLLKPTSRIILDPKSFVLETRSKKRMQGTLLFCDSGGVLFSKSGAFDWKDRDQKIAFYSDSLIAKISTVQQFQLDATGPLLGLTLGFILAVTTAPINESLLRVIEIYASIGILIGTLSSFLTASLYTICDNPGQEKDCKPCRDTIQELKLLSQFPYELPPELNSFETKSR